MMFTVSIAPTVAHISTPSLQSNSTPKKTKMYQFPENLQTRSAKNSWKQGIWLSAPKVLGPICTCTMDETAEDKGKLQTDGHHGHLFDMSEPQYREHVECMCNADTMCPFQSPRVDTVGESRVSRSTECCIYPMHRTEATWSRKSGKEATRNYIMDQTHQTFDSPVVSGKSTVIHVRLHSWCPQQEHANQYANFECSESCIYSF